MAEVVAPLNYIITGQTNSGQGLVQDNRACLNYAYVVYWAAAPSAVLKIDASHDGTGWLPVMTVTASPTTASAQVSAYYPYVRGVVNSAFGGGGSTGSGYLWYGAGYNGR